MNPKRTIYLIAEFANRTNRIRTPPTTTSMPLPQENLTALIHNITQMNHFNRSYLVYEDQHCLALHNYLNPKTPLHVLILPKKQMRSLAEMVEDDKSVIGHLMLIAHQLGTNFTRFGYRLVVNQGGDGCEDYGLVMFHLMGCYQFTHDLGWNDKLIYTIYTTPDYEFRESNYFTF
uniref:Histidine triad nucleotide-binding protein 1 n=1 Tax=Cacopsylla melanoneura TaxID=428564 RepID=A0A8D8ZAU8_9HEMI